MTEGRWWAIGPRGEREFVPGQNDPEAAAQMAQTCPAFLPDEEDEWNADEEVSCYNCAYRRWTQHSFICCRVL